MRFNVFIRKVHYWATAFVAVPVLVILCSGLLLQVKKQWSWVQPKEQRGTGMAPHLELAGILSAVRSMPGMANTSWEDINRLDIRPKRGVAKVSLKSGWEVQVDLGTGRALQTAYRRSDLIESIHDGSFFAGDVSKFGIFLPAGVLLLIMWATGIWMFWLPTSVKRKRKRKRVPPVPTMERESTPER